MMKSQLYATQKQIRKLTKQVQNMDQELQRCTRAAGKCYCICSSRWRADVILKVWQKTRLHQSMHIWLRKNPAKFYPDPIWNDRTFGF